MDKDMEENLEYSNLSDEELIDRLRGGEEAISDYLCGKYKNLVRGKAKSMYILGGDSEDLIQEGMIGLFKAMRDYDSGRDASFFTFADLCVSRQIYTAVNASKRKKHIPLNDYISFYSEDGGQENGKGLSLLDELASGNGGNPEELMIDKERVEYLQEAIANELSSFEKQVLDLYMTQMSTSQIAKVLGRSEKSTDNALQRLKSKIKKLL